MVRRTTEHIPDRGDLIWLTFIPQAGREQAGRRPALVISPQAYNAKSGLALVVPLTSQIKGYPFEVALPDGLPVAGVVLADQVRSLDFRVRQAEFIAKVPQEVLDQVLAKLRVLM